MPVFVGTFFKIVGDRKIPAIFRRYGIVKKTCKRKHWVNISLLFDNPYKHNDFMQADFGSHNKVDRRSPGHYVLRYGYLGKKACSSWNHSQPEKVKELSPPQNT